MTQHDGFRSLDISAHCRPPVKTLRKRSLENKTIVAQEVQAIENKICVPEPDAKRFRVVREHLAGTRNNLADSASRPRGQINDNSKKSVSVTSGFESA